MIARKITYTGNVDTDTAEKVFSIVRDIEITGEVCFPKPGKLVLNLEGDPSMIKLVQHQVESKLSGLAKEVTPIPFKNYIGLDFLR